MAAVRWRSLGDYNRQHMSTTALDVPDVPDLAQYTLQEVRRDADFVLFRGLRNGHGKGNRSSILVKVPVADPPPAATVRSLQEEYLLRSKLDPAYVVRSLAMVRDHGRPIVILDDPLGTPLDLLLDGAMDTPQFLRLAIRIAAALGHVHSRGLVHKDIKPANILVNAALTQAWLMGFGVASRPPRERQSGQIPESLVGTLAYMAPEQTGRMNRSIDSRSDLYALGVTFYEMLTGTLPFTASEPMELVHCHMARQPAAPCETVSGVPRMVSTIIMKLLDKTAEERYQTAGGVESDLRRCLSEWETQHRIGEFPPGEHDTPDWLLMPDKLYGRQREVDTLLASFNRVVTGGDPELVLVCGYSGVGKSSVINELYKVLVPQRGLFASGKFDQYKRDIPYSTLAQAFQSLIRDLLAKSETDLAAWREALHEALGANGRLMIDFVPDLKLVIGEQQPVAELPPQQSQGRFQLVFRRFIGVFARPDHPLTLFLDDLQWLDVATLDLLENLLTQPGRERLLIIGAYRDNEVDPSHPLMRKLDAIRSADALVREVRLAPLAPEIAAQLIADMLHCEPAHCVPLSQLVHEKTDGNPFFLIQFLRAVAEEGLLWFEHDRARWSWDLDRIRAKGYTGNVADLLAGKLSHLPVEVQKALRQLACLGASADAATLSLVLQTPEEQVHADLWDAVRQEFVERSAGVYRFIHDRVQEAAYSLIPEDRRAEAHLRIGRLLMAHTPLEKREEAIFEIVNHLSRGAVLISEPKERLQLADLLLIAANRAKASTAYRSALAYFITGAAFLPEDSWTRHHGLAFALELGWAECEFLTGALADAEQRLAKLTRHALGVPDLAAVARLQEDLFMTLGRSDRAVEVCLDYLRHIDIACPAHPTKEEVREEYERIWRQIGGRSIEELRDLPPMTDLEWRATMEVLTKAATPARFTDQNLQYVLIGRMVNLSLEHGNSDASCYAYALVGAVMGAEFGDYGACSRFGALGLDLVEQRGLDRFEAGVCLVLAIDIIPWTKPIRSGRSLIQRAFDAAERLGDRTFAGYSCAIRIFDLIAAGDPLGDVQLEAEAKLDFVRKRRSAQVDVIAPPLQFIRMMRGLTQIFGSFNDAEFDEGRFERNLEAEPRLTVATCLYWVRKLQALFFANDHAAALAAAAQAERLFWTSEMFFQFAEYHLYAALARAALCDRSSGAERTRHLETLAAHHHRLQKWAANCPENFENRAALVAAEIARLEAREIDAGRLYEQAIRSARANGFVHNEAIAYELAARFYETRGFEEIARFYMRRARERYLQWGATGKVRQLEALHPHLGEPEQTHAPTGTIGAPVEHLELTTVIKVSEALSGEMLLEKLIFKLMRTAIKHAGAARGLLIVPRGAELQVEAEATAGDDVTVRLRDNGETEDALPESVVRSVVRTKESVILDDASTQNPFSSDPYIVRHRARSVLCLPLMSRSKLIGVLYLENNLAPRVFGPTRMTVLKLLALQAAMSLENARLYRDLAKREAKIRRLVDANVVGIVFWDLDGTIHEANDAFLRTVGYDREDLLAGRLRWSDLTSAQRLGRDRQEIVAEIQRTGSLQPFEWELFRKDGSRVPVLNGAASFEGENQGVSVVLDLTERKQVEQALRQSEAYLGEAQRLAHMGSWAYDHVQRRVKHYSDEAFRLFGLDPRRSSGPPQLEETRQLIHPEDRVRVFEELAQIFRDKAEYEQQYRIVLPDGTVRHLHSIGHPVLNQAGELVEYFGTVMDLTERKHAEHRLVVQHRVTRILAEATTVEEAVRKILAMMVEWPGWNLGVVWQIDRPAGVLRCAELCRTPSLEAAQFEAAMRTSTFPRGSGLPGRVWMSGAPEYIPDVIRDPEFDCAVIALHEGLRGACAFPILLDGDVLSIMGFFSRDVWQADANLLDMLATIGSQIGEFTKRAAAVDELHLRVNMLQQIPGGAWSAKPDGTPDIVNSIWFEYTGQTQEYVNSHPEAWMASVHPEDRERVSRTYWEGIRSGHGFTMEARYFRVSDGTYRWHLDRAVSVRDPEGNILRFVGTSTDVHDFRQVQDELRNAQAELAHMTRVMTMGELTASIAHEVNQPLGAIVTSAAAGARWLASKPPQIDKARRALERIAKDGKRAAEIIRRIRALMKRQAPRKEWLDINETILEVIALAQYQLRRSEILVDTQIGSSLPLVRGDRVQLQQVLLNLIINAIEAMTEIKERPRELWIMSGSDGPDTVTVEVRDSGTGLIPEHAPHLFEPFYTTKAEGLGVGLSISRSIVEAHGGRISAAANAPHGTVFRVSLPVNETIP
jgi:PAS domain S-box-containing protein